MKHFQDDTYIVLDLPKKIADKVKRLRVEYGYTMSLPVEITVAGSIDEIVERTYQIFTPEKVMKKLK